MASVTRHISDKVWLILVSEVAAVRGQGILTSAKLIIVNFLPGKGLTVEQLGADSMLVIRKRLIER